MNINVEKYGTVLLLASLVELVSCEPSLVIAQTGAQQIGSVSYYPPVFFKTEESIMQLPKRGSFVVYTIEDV